MFVASLDCCVDDMVNLQEKINQTLHDSETYLFLLLNRLDVIQECFESEMNINNLKKQVLNDDGYLNEPRNDVNDSESRVDVQNAIEYIKRQFKAVKRDDIHHKFEFYMRHCINSLASSFC